MRCAAIVFLQLELNLNIGLKITFKQPSSYTECLQAYVNVYNLFHDIDTCVLLEKTHHSENSYETKSKSKVACFPCPE